MRSVCALCLLLGLAASVVPASEASWPAKGDTLAPATTVRLEGEWPHPDDTLAWALLDSLQVGKIKLELSQESEEAGQQLWGLLKSSELSERCAQVRVPGGTSAWPTFRARLVANAGSNGFDTASLASVLDIIEKQEPYLTTEGQLLPFAAYLAHQADDAVWIILCRWESGYSPRDDGHTAYLKAGHIRGWAFLEKNGRQIGYTTCK